MDEVHDPYRPPHAELTVPIRTDGKLLSELRRLPTLALLGLGIVTLGVYWAHYVRRQTDVLNRHLVRRRLNVGLPIAVLVFSYASVGMFVASMLMDDTAAIEWFEETVDRVSAILLVIWAFAARSRMHRLLNPAKNDAAWFHGALTFVFGTLYFNYKVNTLYEQAAATPPSVVPT